MTISPAHSGTMGQESGEIWSAETLLQPILPKSDRLLGGGVDQMGLLRGIPANHILAGYVVCRSKEKFGANH
jgi:hypothetical protein